jgi:hypothetical protein
MLRLRDDQWERIGEHCPEEHIPKDARPEFRLLHAGGQAGTSHWPRAYYSDGLDDGLKQDGVNMIASHRSTRKLKTQDGRYLRRYQRRWLVERFFAWLQWKRRLLIRWEYYAANFLGFVQLASITILLKRF